MARRAAVIIFEACTLPCKPSWGHAKVYEGLGAAEEAVAPSLRAHALNRASEEAGIVSGRAKASLRGAPASGRVATAAGRRGAAVERAARPLEARTRRERHDGGLEGGLGRRRHGSIPR